MAAARMTRPASEKEQNAHFCPVNLHFASVKYQIALGAPFFRLVNAVLLIFA